MQIYLQFAVLIFKIQCKQMTGGHLLDTRNIRLGYETVTFILSLFL